MRLPPGQTETKKWPVLHYGRVPRVDLTHWRFTITGLVEEPLSLGWDEMRGLPEAESRCDIHCVTHWSKFDNRFSGASVSELLRRARPKPEARFALVHADPDFTTNLALADLDRPENLLAWSHDGEPLSADHGGPLRLVVPHLYFWKSAKWVRGIELLAEDHPGFWERNGYHMRGDPWAAERYNSPSVTQWVMNTLRNDSKR